MLDTININEYKVTKMYRNGEIIWEMPRVMYEFNTPQVGHETIIGKTYPGRCNVEVYINRTSVGIGTSSSTGYFTKSFDAPIKSGDRVNLKITKEGWQSATESFSIR